ncbi:unnamed protein product [Effrenium voratum]|uniref:Uncharacterized protein n=1 Tax=Effrenium voratum TaxID=2562239 RepID=A0AA36J9X2_9DINO|nr:unnamed protein product [Effrenium voratum]
MESEAMARSVSALEIFADRQPVDFGLTAVVELWLGPNQVLHSNQDTARLGRITGPGSWLSAKQLDTKAAAEKATYAWRLQAPSPGGAESRSACIAFREGDHIIPVVLPREEKVGASPAEIDLLFQVEEVFRAKKLGKELDMDQLASAASHLGAALVSDLTSALDLDDATAIQASLKRMRGSVVPRSAEARRRLCELQPGGPRLLAAVASGDTNELAMATREAARVGGEDAAQFEGYSAAKQKMSTLQAKRLQQQALEVIRGETKERGKAARYQDLESLMAVISVALGRSDWDREWDQIWTEVLEEGRAKVKQMLEVAKAPGDGLPVRDHKLIARIAVLGRKHNLSPVKSKFDQESVAAAVAAQHFATLAAMARDSSGSPEFDIVLEATQKEMQRIAKLWDREGKDEARKLLGQAVQAFQLPEAAQLKASAEQCSQDASAREAQILAEVEKQLSARGESLEETWVRQVVQGLATCRAWRWPEVQEDARETLAKQVEQHLDAMLIEKTMKPDERGRRSW